MVLILMGVSGSGKTTIGARLAQDLGWRFLDADDIHPAENIRKMTDGQPLTEEDREPWLERLRREIGGARAGGGGGARAGAARGAAGRRGRAAGPGRGRGGGREG